MAIDYTNTPNGRRYNEDLSIKTLVDRWAERDYDWVIEELWNNPPHATATFLSMGTDEWYGPKRLLRPDVNKIANMLTDRFIKERDGK